jgi:hypothetical protein
MIAMIATVLDELLTHDCLELLAEYPASLWIFHTPSFHQSTAAKVQGRLYNVYINLKERSIQRVRSKEEKKEQRMK